jgi:hypothetical protein
LQAWATTATTDANRTRAERDPGQLHVAVLGSIRVDEIGSKQDESERLIKRPLKLYVTATITL